MAKKLRLDVYLDELDPIRLIRAITAVRLVTDHPGVEMLVQDRRFEFPKLLAKIVDEWNKHKDSDKSKGKAEIFPWSDDIVASYWVKCRKDKEPDKQSILYELEKRSWL